MQNIRRTFYSLLLLSFFSCQQEATKQTESIEQFFTPLAEINPQVYFATEANKAIDPNNELTEMFRNKKAADMANPEKPRPFKESDLSPLENISHQQDWTPIQEVFKFNWQELPVGLAENWSKEIKTRLIFDNADLKVVELAIAPGSVLPLHAQATPSCYHILGGEAEVLSNEKTAKVYPGTTINFDSYDKKRVRVTSNDPLKILWFSWAPEGDQSYLNSGYYLTGSNIHIQPLEAVLPEHFKFWDKEIGRPYEEVSNQEEKTAGISYINAQRKAYENVSKNQFYPSAPTYRNALDEDWVNLVNLDPKSFFFAKDISKLGDALKALARVAKIKSVFRVQRPEKGYDLNYSYLAWGPHSKYPTHSHAICEFYYVLKGDVEYIIDGNKYHGIPGNFYFHPPYYDHEKRGLKTNVPFLVITGSWIPFGKRALFEQPFFLLEDRPSSSSTFPSDFNFHDFKLNEELEYGIL